MKYTEKRFPSTKKVPVADCIHGKVIIDEYRWLENFTDDKVQEWIAQQNNLTREYLDKLPQREWLKRRFTELKRYDDISAPRQVLVGDRIFYSAIKKDWERWAYYTKENENAESVLLLDPNQWGLNTLGAVYPSRDGKYIAYSVEEAGKENPIIKIMEVETGRTLPDSLQGWRQSGVAWLPDNSGFYYTANPLKGTVPEGEENYWDAVYFHKLGTPTSEDKKIFFHPEVKEYFHNAAVSEDGRYVLFYRSMFFKNEVYIQKLGTSEPMQPIATGFDAEYSVILVEDRLIIKTNLDAPNGRVFSTTLDKLDKKYWQEIIPECEDHLEYIEAIGGHLYAVYIHNAHTNIKIYTIEGEYIRDLPLPTLGSAWVWGYWSKPDVWVSFSSFTHPLTIYKYAFESDKLILYHRPPIDIELSNFVVEQVWYDSKDGTKIPMFLVHHKDIKKNGKNPVYLTGYGGFKISIHPYFSVNYAVFLESGGMIAIPNLRGGGEFGDEWHKAGMLDKKQNVFDDFISAAEYLIENKYTSPEYLAIGGASNGGLLTGAALVQAPELFKAVYVGVPLLDMLRYHKYSYANIWAEEYGSADNAEQFEYLIKYSPYHNVKKQKYPAVLFEASDNDPRCHPMHAMKMAAKVQENQTGEAPILLIVRRHAGHGGGTTKSEQIEEDVDMWSFIMSQLGMNLR
ncbi:MAG: prolyl oligopeptidase family serine peptidase [candidate division WOR-3 bacterium]